MYFQSTKAWPCRLISVFSIIFQKNFLLEKERHLQSQTLFEQSTHLKQQGIYLHNNCWNLIEEQTSFLTDTVFTNWEYYGPIRNLFYSRRQIGLNECLLWKQSTLIMYTMTIHQIQHWQKIRTMAYSSEEAQNDTFFEEKNKKDHY